MASQFPIFINYRRTPDEPAADQFYDYLAASFPGLVFLDKEGIGPGEEFGETLLPRVKDSMVFLALIGPYWLEQHTEAGPVCRLDEASDYVRREIETAFSSPCNDGRERLIIPVVLGDSAKPAKERLPLSIRCLTGRNFVFYRGAQEHRRMEFRRMVRQIAARLQLDEPPDCFARLEGSIAATPFKGLPVNLHGAPVGLASNEAGDSEVATDASDLQEINGLLKLLHQGQDNRVWERFHLWRQGGRWNQTSKKVRGRLLKALSRNAVQTTGDLTSARAFLAEAKVEDPNGDYEGLEAQIMWAESGAAAALKLLNNPSSYEGWLFRAALLLEHGQAQDALAICFRESWPGKLAEDIGRLKVRCLLALDRVAEASGAAAEVTAQPDCTWMAKTLVGQCLVCCCLADRFVRRDYESNPRPVPRELVRDDDTSRKHLEQAAAIFAEVLELTGLNASERNAVSAWKLTSLALHPRRESEAEGFARTLIASDRTNANAIGWAIARGWKFDWDATIIPAVYQAARQSREFNDWQKLIMLLGSLAKFEELMNVLEEAKQDYESSAQAGEWFLMLGQTMALRGQMEEAETVLESTLLTKAHREALQNLIRRVKAKSPKELAAIASVMEQEWRERPAEVSLWELAKAKADAGDEKFIVGHADLIVADLPTGSAVHLVAEAFLSQQMPKEGLAWVERHRWLMPGGEFIPGIQRIIVHWKRQLGQISESLELAHAGAKKSGRWQDWQSVIEHGLLMGDHSKVTEGAKAFLRDPETPPQFLVQAAYLTRTRSTGVARELLVKASDRLEPGNPGFMKAVKLSQILGDIGRERTLFEKLSAAAASSQQAAGCLDDVRQMLHGDFERERATVQAYHSGDIPLHALCRNDSPLPLVFDRSFNLHPLLKDPPPLFLHHGGRAMIDPPPAGAGLFMDISGLLTAGNLGLLDQVAAHWGTLFLPLPAVESIAEALIALENDTNKLDAMRSICQLTSTGRIKTASTDEEAAFASQEAGQDIQNEWEDFLERRILTSPLIGGASAEVWKILKALDQAGKLTREQAARARQMLTSATDAQTRPIGPADDAVFSPQQTVELDSSDLEVLAEAGLLEIAAAQFNLVTSARGIRRARRFVTVQEWREGARERLISLQQWISTASEKQLVQLLPVPPSDCADERERDFWYQSIRVLLLYKPAQPAAVWIEERLFNGHGKFGEMTTLTVSDVLGALRVRGVLTEEEWITALYKLRSANVQHLPVHEKEVEAHLRMAKLGKGGRLVETPEMQMLRRRVARGLRERSEWLGQPKEGDYRSALGSAPESFWGYWIIRLSTVLVSRWLDRPLQAGDGSLDRAIAESLWILENLWFDGGCEVCPALPGNTGKDAMPSPPLLAFLVGSRRVEREAQESFVPPQKIMYNFGVYVFGFSGRAWRDAAAQFSRIIAAHSKGQPADNARRMGLQRIVGALPGKLRSQLRLSRQVAEFLQFDRFVEIGEPPVIRFSEEKFWAQVRKALSGQNACIDSADRRQWKLKPLSRGCKTNEVPSVTFISANDKSRFNFSHPGLAALLPDRQRAAALLHRDRPSFDLSHQEMDRLVQRVLSLPKAKDRITLLTEAWTTSAVRHYEELREQSSLTVAHLLPPSFSSLRNYLRLPADGRLDDFVRQWEQSARTLLKEEGIQTAWERLTLLPVRLPPVILDAIGRVKSAELEAWTARVTEVPLSWLQRIFWASLQSQTGRMLDVEAVMRSIADDKGQSQVRGFLDLLRWSFKCLLAREDCEDQPAVAVIACAWAHAGTVHRLLQTTSNEGGPLQEELERLRLPPGPCLWFRFRREIEADACNPLKVDESLLLADGVGTLLPEQIWSGLADDVKDLIGRRIDANFHWNTSEGGEGNLLGSWLAARNLKPTAAGSRQLQELDPADLSVALSQLNVDYAQVPAWSLIFAFLHHKDADWRSKAMSGVREIIELHGLAALLKIKGDASRFFSSCLRITLCFSVDGQNLCWVLPVVLKAAADLDLDGADAELDWELFQCLFNASYGENCGNTVAGRWAGAALNLLNACPLLAAWIRNHLGLEFHRCNPEEQSDLLPLLLRAREFP